MPNKPVANGDPWNRDSHGRFGPGNQGGPGRPRRAVEMDYLVTLTEACPPERWRRIVEKAIEQAEAGNAKARDWLSLYLLPKPGEGSLLQAAVSDTLDGDPVARGFRNALRGALDAEEMYEAIERLAIAMQGICGRNSGIPCADAELTGSKPLKDGD